MSKHKNQSQNEIFCYSNYFKYDFRDERLASMHHPPKFNLHFDQSSPTIKRLPELIRNFTEKIDCPYCGHRMESNLTNYDLQTGMSYVWGKKSGHQCKYCGWWFIQVKGIVDDEETNIIRDHLTTYEGIICTFDSGQYAHSLRQLSVELSEYRRDISFISPKEMERLIGKILSQHYNCNVHHVGRSGDKGIDLLIIESDKTIAVQVKHRISGKKTEGVLGLRDFVGAIVGEGYQEGLYVTTAEQYSPHAKEYANQVSRRFAPINIITINELRDLINNICSKDDNKFIHLWSREV